MATVRDKITSAFRLLGTHAQGETPSANDMNEALARALDMLDSWSADGKKIHYRIKDELTLVPGTASYTFGTGGDLNSARPSRVISVLLKLSDGTEHPLDIIGAAEWSRLQLKTLQNTIPEAVYFEGTFPLETLNLYYVPSAAETLVIYSEKPFTALTLSTTFEFPPSYAKAFRYGLALELAPEYGVQLSPDIYRGYTNAMDLLERRNTQDILMNSDPFGAAADQGKEYDILSGWY